jgi:hypothetical protein
MAEFNFEPPSPSSWTRLDRVAANHEAAHAVMAVLLDIEVFEARIDRPIDRHPSTSGWVKAARPEEAWRAVALSIAPLIVDKRVPKFPSLNSDDGDEFNAAVVVHDAGISPERFSEIVELATELIELPSSKRAITALSGELLERGAVPGDEVCRIIDKSLHRQGGRGLSEFEMVAPEIRQPVRRKKVGRNKCL